MSYSLNISVPFIVNQKKGGFMNIPFGSSPGPIPPTPTRHNWFYVQNINDDPEELKVYDFGAGGITIEVSRDGFEWEEWKTTEPYETHTMELQPGEKVYMRSKTNSWEDAGMMGVLKVGGNILSLLYGADFDDSQRTLPEGSHHFSYIFTDGTLKDASDLIIDVEKVYSQSFLGMFYQCTQLKTPPQIRIGNVGENGCEEMFAGCTSLEYAPALTAMVVDKYGYHKMFQGCTSLVDAPRIGATTIMAYGCANMFEGCTSLLNVADFNFHDIGTSGCYAMFKDCTSLESMPDIPCEITTRSCYQSMFEGCTSLKYPTSLRATTLSDNCYQAMFKGCTSLTQAPVMLPDSVGQYSMANMFEGCTSLISTSSLPAEELANYCYQSMFEGCTSLIHFPEIAAVTTGINSMANMFNGCTALVNTPSLYALEVVGEAGARDMFKDCTALVNTPNLQRVRVINNAGCQGMFQGCTSLTHTAPMGPVALSSASNSCKSMYQDCTSLTTAGPIRITNGATNNCTDMFRNCKNLCMVSNLTDNYEATQPWQCEANWMVGVSYNGVFVKADGVEWGRSWSGVPASNPDWSWVIISESDLMRGDIMYYKTSDGNTINPNASKFADAAHNPVSITSNTVNANGIGEIRFSAPVHYITGSAFLRQLNLKAVWLPYTLKSTGDGAFNEDANIEFMWFWPEVNVFEDTFNNLTSLKNVYVNSINPPTLSANQASNLKTYGCSIHVPYESVERYKTAENWTNVAGQIVGM